MAAVQLPSHDPMLLAVGRGIQAFASIELAVGITYASMMEPAPRLLSVISLHEIRTFESKLKVVDAAARHALKPDCLSRWRTLSAKIRRRAEVRNKLAHWTVSYWPGIKDFAQANKVKVALVPPVWSMKHGQVMWGEQKDSDVRPLFLADLDGFHHKCNSLVSELFAFCKNMELANPAPA